MAAEVIRAAIFTPEDFQRFEDQCDQDGWSEKYNKNGLTVSKKATVCVD